jgi:hypothetical protein
LSFRFPQCGLFCFGSNSSGLCRLMACNIPMHRAAVLRGLGDAMRGRREGIR